MHNIIRVNVRVIYLHISNEESNLIANSSGRTFLNNSQGLAVISLLEKYYVPLAHINKVIKF